MADQLVTEAAAYTTQKMTIHAISRIWTCNPSNQTAKDLHLRLHSHWDWHGPPLPVTDLTWHSHTVGKK